MIRRLQLLKRRFIEIGQMVVENKLEWAQQHAFDAQIELDDLVGKNKLITGGQPRWQWEWTVWLAAAIKAHVLARRDSGGLGEALRSVGADLLPGRDNLDRALRERLTMGAGRGATIAGLRSVVYGMGGAIDTVEINDDQPGRVNIDVMLVPGVTVFEAEELRERIIERLEDIRPAAIEFRTRVIPQPRRYA